MMNERIKLLTEQATKQVTKPDGHYIVQEWQRVFAELIVRECMSMSDELKAQYLSFRKNTMDFDEKHIYAEGEAACDTLKYKMKKHFGVEK